MSDSTTDATITPLAARQAHHNPFEAARLSLIKKLLALKAPAAFGAFPYPSDFTAVADHLREAASIVDEWFAAIGHQVKDNAPVAVDMALFLSPCTDAIDGNALWECHKATEAVIEEHNEMVRRA